MKENAGTEVFVDNDRYVYDKYDLLSKVEDKYGYTRVEKTNYENVAIWNDINNEPHKCELVFGDIKNNKVSVKLLCEDSNEIEPKRIG